MNWEIIPISKREALEIPNLKVVVAEYAFSSIYLNFYPSLFA